MTKTLITLGVLIVLALGMAACGDKTPAENATAAGEAVGDAAQITGDAVSDAATATGDAVGNAVQATGAFLNQPKDADVKAAKEKLARMEKNWRALLARAAPTTGEGKADLKEADRQMTEALATARAKLEEALDASDKDWQQNIKPALDAAVQRSQELYNDVQDRFGSK